MTLPLAYVDTSAFAKRFFAEKHTQEMEAFALSGDWRLAVSSLTLTEFRSVLKRRLRAGSVGAPFVAHATEQLSIEIASDALAFHAIDASLFELAGLLIERLGSPLGTLDALHLACAKAMRAALLVSADRQLLKAAQEAGLDVLDLS